MRRRRSMLPWAVMLCAIAVVSFHATAAQETEECPGSVGEIRADVLTIDVSGVFGDLERPAVVFLHDSHTDALEKKNKDCNTCHLIEKGPQKDRLSPKFKRLKDISRDDVMDIYHTECMGCHRDLSADGEKSGPVEICGECHRDRPAAVSTRQPMGFDRSLHFRHSRAHEDKCERCHHEYDKTEKKLFYAKEKEGSCRYCHKEVTEENRISLRLASHISCIDCHRTALTEKKVAGPVKCVGCHDVKKQQLIEKVKDVPRIGRKQPDIVLIRPDKQDIDEQELALRTGPVPFDHKTHEGKNETCRVCHHASLDSCDKCHTLAGAKDGKEIRLETAMHQVGSKRSCLGCHEISKREPSCSGCHVFMEKGRKNETSSCFQCHLSALKGTVLSTEKPEIAAEEALRSRRAPPDTHRDEDIPEKVIIKELVDKYEGVEFPHRKIIHTLINNIKDNTLASYFHVEKNTPCRSCHHNSPGDVKPPRCVSCHGKPFDEADLLRPGMKGAYHQQCIGCHKAMGIEKPNATDCTECHKERTKPEKVFSGGAPAG
ncbi:MAG: cytochrome c3 family protein [Thermodesulfobacteriota bacterium]|nr:cytochrome c3 family protein [Thermodesulfobacteriota bacterium]